MSNAAKHRKKAAEFEQLKQVDRAIAMYIKAIDESEAEGEEVDVALLNKVGDLTLRQGRVADAVTYYERAIEHYATSSLFNNAIALCNKILRNAPGRSNVYFTLGRICAKKGLRGDATRNFLEYATRMQQDGRIDEGMRALAEVSNLMPELTEVRRLVEEHATRAGIELPRRKTPAASAASSGDRPRRDDRTSELIFLDIGESGRARNTPPLSPRIPTPPAANPLVRGASVRTTPSGARSAERGRTGQVGPASLDAFLLFDPTRPGAVTPVGARAVTPSAGPSLPSGEAVPETHAGSAPDWPTESILELTTEPSSELPIETTLEVAIEPMPELVAEPMLELSDAPPVELVIEPTADLAIEPMAELAIEPMAELTIEPMLELAAEPILPPTIELMLVVPAAPTLETDVILDVGIDYGLDLVVEPMAQGAAEGDPTEPLPDRVPELVSALTPEPVPEPVSEPTAEVAPEPSVVRADLVASAFDPELESSDALHSGVHTESARSLEGLEVMNLSLDADPVAVDGLLTGDYLAVSSDPDEAIELKDLIETEVATDPRAAALSIASVLDHVDTGNIETLPDLVLEDFEHVADDPDVAMVTGGRSGTPAYGTTFPRAFTPIEVTPVPELDAAIAAGAVAAARGAVELAIEERQPPFRLDPHDFILPGELPPLMVDDEFMIGSLRAFSAVPGGGDREPPQGDEHDDAEFEHDDTIFVDARDYEVAAATATSSDSSSVDAVVVASADEVPSTPDATLDAPAETPDAAIVDEAPAADETAESTVAHANVHAISTTPSLPIAAVAAEANLVATSRRDELSAAVAAAPNDWVLRRRHAEALFEVGERERGLSELQVALSGFVHGGHLAVAADIADELVRISPERIAYHQKRVELAVRLADQQRLRAAYLDLADALVEAGDEARAHAVYARVLELDPWDPRARTALGAAAPPPPPEAAQEDFVDLAEWLRDDEPASTRMRMRAPQVSGDEQADFESLLRHFKEGVSRSLGEEDYESHYDLGVAYKEMGLLDDAIAEFQKALRSRRHRLPAYEALGQCFVEQSRHSVAATVLTRALHEPGLGDEHRVGVLYLLAYSCEALQRWDEARSYYSRVFATDIHFRDVAARLAALDLIAR